MKSLIIAVLLVVSSVVAPYSGGPNDCPITASAAACAGVVSFSYAPGAGDQPGNCVTGTNCIITGTVSMLNVSAGPKSVTGPTQVFVVPVGVLLKQL
jgi:hypothetical protein